LQKPRKKISAAKNTKAANLVKVAQNINSFTQLNTILFLLLQAK
jgi:hypothetical protein